MEDSKLGLVLSGGGTRGLAHAGVLKFLNEKNIKPNIISCCSAGSIVGSLMLWEITRRNFGFFPVCLFFQLETFYF
jgi:NTE family protein